MPDTSQYQATRAGVPFHERASIVRTDPLPAKPASGQLAWWFDTYIRPGPVVNERVGGANLPETDHWYGYRTTDLSLTRLDRETAQQNFPTTFGPGQFAWVVRAGVEGQARGTSALWAGKDASAIAYVDEIREVSEDGFIDGFEAWALTPVAGFSPISSFGARGDVNVFLIGSDIHRLESDASWTSARFDASFPITPYYIRDRGRWGRYTLPDDPSVLVGAGLYIDDFSEEGTPARPGPPPVPPVPDTDPVVTYSIPASGWAVNQFRGEISNFTSTPTGGVLSLEVIVEGRWLAGLVPGLELLYRGHRWAIVSIEEVGRRKYMRATLTRLMVDPG